MIRELTKDQYEKEFGSAPTAIPRASTATTSQPKERGVLESIVKRPLERLVIEPAIRTGQAIGSAALTPFLNDEQKARMDASLSQDTKLNVPFFGEFIARRLKNGSEGVKQIAGETLETAGYLTPVKGTSLPAKSASGAAAGYAFDVGSKLQQGESVQTSVVPGAGAVAGAVLPVLGSIIGKLPKRLEETNLRLSPTEKTNLAKQGKDIAKWVSEKKITGSPEVRYDKVNTLYDDMERQVTRVVDASNITFPKSSVISELEKIPAKYADHLSEYPEVVSKIGRMIQTLKQTRGDSISAGALNKMKRAEWKSAYNKQGSQVINEVSDEAASVFKSILDNSVPALKSLNPEYGRIITARKVLFKAIARPQTGLVGKLLGTVAGAGIGGTVGGGVGAAGGAVIGEQVASKVLGTATRSRVGAAIQSVSDILSKTPIDKDGNLQIPAKALITLLQTLTQETAPEEQQQGLSQPQSNTLSEEKRQAVLRGAELGQMVDPTGAIGSVGKVGKALSNIHPDDLYLMERFIDYARMGRNISDNAFTEAEKLAQHFGISMDKGLKGVANEFEKILQGVRPSPDTVQQTRDTLGRFSGSI